VSEVVKESRYGPTVRERTKLLAALLRTPDESLSTFAVANAIADGTADFQLRQLRDVLDALGRGLATSPDTPFWRQLNDVWALLHGKPLAAARAARPEGASPAHEADEDMSPWARASEENAATPPPAPGQPKAAPQSPWHSAARSADAAAPPGTPSAIAADTTPFPKAERAAAPQEDFRHEVMAATGPDSSDAPTLANDELDIDWKVHNPDLRYPAPDQNQTDAMVRVGLSGVWDVLDAAQDTLNWPLERVARLSAAVAAQHEHGEPSTDEICRRFKLANGDIVSATLRLWSLRFDDDEQLAREHARLVSQNRQKDPT